MTQSVINFEEALKAKNFRYFQENERRLFATFTGRNAAGIRLTFIFGEDGTDVTVKVFSLCKVPEPKESDVLIVCNTLNEKFRWLKFYIDKDMEVTASVDATITAETAAPVCMELLGRTVNIVDEAYPEIMRTIW